MFKQLLVFLAYVGPLLAIALKVGLAIGATGTAIESLGLVLQKFTSARVRAWGRGLVAAGKMLEAWGADVPKFVNSATGWVDKLSKLAGLAVLFLLVCSLHACAASPATREAQLGAIVAGCKVSLDLERDAGAAGAEGESERGCEAALRTLDPVKP